MKNYESFYFKSLGNTCALEKIEKEEFYTLFKEPLLLTKVSLSWEIIDNDDMVKLKMSIFNENKRIESVYFRKEIKTLVFIFKKKTGLFYFGEYTKPFRKKKMVGTIKTFPQVCMTDKFIGQLRVLFKMLQSSDWKKSQFVKDYVVEYRGILEQYQNKVLDFIGYPREKMRLTDFVFLLKLRKYDVKIPNNWTTFVYMYLHKKNVKLNNYNLVDCFLMRNDKIGNIYTKKYKKFFNTADITPLDAINIVGNLRILKSLVGPDYFKEYDLNDLKENLHGFSFFNSQFIQYITNQDRLNIHRYILKSLEVGNRNLHSLHDHLGYIHELHERIGTSPRFVFKSLEEFENEHYELSNMVHKMRNGYMVRNYDPKFEKLFYDSFDGFEVKLLKNSDEYVEESNHQRNCVKTYTKDKDCFILSLRDSDNKRITIEYEKSYNGVIRKQTYGFANSQVDLNIYGKALSMLDTTIENYFKKTDDLQYEMITKTIINEFYQYTHPQKISWKNLETKNSYSIFEEENFNFTTNF
jgi:hypothetical protein